MSQLDRIFSWSRRRDIQLLGSLAPVYPKTGELRSRNHEYPFEIAADDWSPPCADDAFKKGEIKRFHITVDRVCGKLSEIVVALERIYP